MNEAPVGCSTQEKAPGLAHKHYNWQEMFAKDKQSSLLRKSVNYGQKSFITLGPGFNVIIFVTAVSYEFS
jgi:hypothetical protein